MHERLRFESEIDLLAGTMYPAVAEFESPAVAEKCKREWEKFVGALPRQVTDALGTGDSRVTPPLRSSAIRSIRGWPFK